MLPRTLAAVRLPPHGTRHPWSALRPRADGAGRGGFGHPTAERVAVCAGRRSLVVPGLVGVSGRRAPAGGLVAPVTRDRGQTAITASCGASSRLRGCYAGASPLAGNCRPSAWAGQLCPQAGLRPTRDRLDDDGERIRPRRRPVRQRRRDAGGRRRADPLPERRTGATGGQGFEGERSIPSPDPNVAHWVGWLMTPNGPLSVFPGRSFRVPDRAPDRFCSPPGSSCRPPGSSRTPALSMSFPARSVSFA